MKKIFYLFVCLAIAIFAFSNAKAQTYFITGHNDPNQCDGFSCVFGDSLCVNTNSYSPALRLETSYGDGTKDTVSFNTGFLSSPGLSDGIWHHYEYLGTYTIKHVLLYNNNRIDSLHYSAKVTGCNFMYIGAFCDYNSNCVFDSSEHSIIYPNKLEIDSAGQILDTVTFTSGLHYVAYGSVGTVYSFKILPELPGMLSACPFNTIYDTVHGNAPQTKYFGFTCNSAISYDLSVHAVVPVTGIYDQWGNIYIDNMSCYPQGATVTLYYSPKYAYSGGANPTPVTHSGNTISWNISGPSANAAGPVSIWYGLWYQTSAPLTIGDTVQSYFSVTPISGDINPANNVCIIVDTVKAGCDPNEMFVNPAGKILAGTTLQYDIKFMNTGNDTAFNIYALDSLSDLLDIKSFKILYATAPMDLLITKTSTGHNLIKFDFPGINLLDSSHHGACTAMLSFNIKTKTGLPNGTIIPNKAGIFFDDNAVVNTNTVYNTIGIPSSVNTEHIMNSVRVYPNPLNNSLTIEGAEAGTVLQICNIIGQQMYAGTMSSSKQIIDTKELSKGIYLLQFINKDGSKDVRKIVKE